MHMKPVFFVLVFTLVLAMVVLPGCNQNLPSDENGAPVNGENDENDENGVQQEIEAWIEDSKMIFLGQSRELEGTQYILVTYGEKQTGGYVVEIRNYVVGEEALKVTVYFSEPGPDDVVTQAITYPYDLLEIEATGLPVEFVVEGGEDFLPQLKGIDYLQRVVARSQWILIFAPSPGSPVEREFTVEGVGNVFEGNIQYMLKGADGTVLVSGHTTAEMGNWRYFTTDITVDEAVNVDEGLLLEIFTRSAKDGSVENLIQIELESAV